MFPKKAGGRPDLTIKFFSKLPTETFTIPRTDLFSKSTYHLLLKC